ncbi:MAG: hypothetical protein AB1664_14705, partial [Thermodesulfobacteriota bacterium]
MLPRDAGLACPAVPVERTLLGKPTVAPKIRFSFIGFYLRNVGIFEKHYMTISGPVPRRTNFSPSNSMIHTPFS